VIGPVMKRRALPKSKRLTDRNTANDILLLDSGSDKTTLSRSNSELLLAEGDLERTALAVEKRSHGKES
jgi:hypothetical protein